MCPQLHIFNSKQSFWMSNNRCWQEKENHQSKIVRSHIGMTKREKLLSSSCAFAFLSNEINLTPCVIWSHVDSFLRQLCFSTLAKKNRREDFDRWPIDDLFIQQGRWSMDCLHVWKFMRHEEVEISDICHSNRLFERDKSAVIKKEIVFWLFYHGKKRGVSHSESDQ